MIVIIVEDLYSCQTVGGKLYLDLATFPILAYGKAFIGEMNCFLLNEVGDL